MPSKADIREHMRVLRRFVDAYCREHHAPAQSGPCEQCGELLAYARGRLSRCPREPKPKCKNCRTHCYAPPYRERMRRVMRFSVRHFAARGRIDVLLRGLKFR